MNWKQEKLHQLEKAQRVIIKVGSAVLASADGLDLGSVEQLAGQISTLHDRGLAVMLVSSGAVAAGRGVLRQSREISGLPHKQAAAAIGQSRLMHHYDLAFGARGKISAQVLLTRDDLKSRSRFLHISNTFATLLSWGAIPIVNENDTVAVEELKFGDNDCLSSLLLNLTEADLFINLTSASGVYAAPPVEGEAPTILPFLDNLEELDLETLCGGKTSLGTGGMYSKLLAARRAAQIHVPTCIVPGREPDILLRVFAGEDIGTWVCAAKKSISRRKFRLAYNAVPSGTLIIDSGAAAALVNGGKSLLPAGVTAVEGNFGAGALVRICTADTKPVAVGLCNYTAAALRRIKGLKLSEIPDNENIHAEAVHRDNMLLDAAL